MVRRANVSLGPAVTLGDDLAAVLPELRAMAESRMRAHYLVIRPGEPVTDENGDVTYPVTVVYDGKGYMRYPGLAFEQNTDVAGATVVVSRIVVRIPFGPICRPGDLVYVRSDIDNSQLAGTLVRIGSIDDQSQATAQRLIADDLQAGYNFDPDRMVLEDA